MKKIILSVTCIAVTGIYVIAQTRYSIETSPAPATESLVVIPPPPPAPPIPPIPPAPPTDLINLPVPPAPPAPPAPLVPIEEEIAIACAGSFATAIINSNGYEISVQDLKGKDVVVLKKDGKLQKIKLVTWNAHRKLYEKKYGQLPPRLLKV